MTQTSLSLFALVRVRVLGRGRHVSQRHVSDITHVPSRTVVFESRASTSAGKRGWRLTLSPQYPTCAFSALRLNTAARTPSSHYRATANQTHASSRLTVLLHQQLCCSDTQTFRTATLEIRINPRIAYPGLYSLSQISSHL